LQQDFCPYVAKKNGHKKLRIWRSFLSSKKFESLRVIIITVHKQIHAVFIVALLLIVPAVSLAAATYSVKAGDTLGKIAAANHLSLARVVQLNPQIKNINLIYPGQSIHLAASAQTTSAAQPANTTTTTKTQTQTQSQAPAAGEKRFSAYTTGYGWPDNTPKGSAEISHSILHLLAGGTGTYADPITVAVGHTIASGKDTLDYPAGTKFYIPNLRKYFITEDTCGDGKTPQNGPCHTGYQGHPWLDLWVGGNSGNQKQTLACEENITDLHMVIQNPASNYAVIPGDVTSSCGTQYGDSVVLK
jgi:LysM repeat protein